VSGGPALGPALDLRPPRSLTDPQFRRKCGKSSEKSGVVWGVYDRKGKAEPKGKLGGGEGPDRLSANL